MDRWVAGLDGVFGYWLVWVDFLGGWEGRRMTYLKGSSLIQTTAKIIVLLL